MNDTGTSPRTIAINGETVTTRALTLDQLIREQGYGDRKVATAINGRFVPERARPATALAAGDHVEVLSARQGG